MIRKIIKNKQFKPDKVVELISGGSVIKGTSLTSLHQNPIFSSVLIRRKKHCFCCCLLDTQLRPITYSRQCSAVQCTVVQCSAVQCSAVQCSAVQCSAVQCSAVQCSAVHYSTIQCSLVQPGLIQRNQFGGCLVTQPKVKDLASTFNDIQ